MGAKQFWGGVAAGAGLVYFLDPERGAARRGRLRERFGARPAPPRRYGSRLGDIDGLEAASVGPDGDAGELPHLARLAGGALVAYGLLRRGRMGGLLRTVGMGLAVGGLRETAPGRLRPRGERRRTIDIQQTLHVEAPLEQVYAFWADYENFPLFLSNVREVRDLGAGRSHWVLRGPGARPVSWNAVLTEREENRRLAWRSEPGSVLESAGVIRFGREGGGTRIDLRFCYSPPAGRVGRRLADFFGGDPRTRVTEDLGRLKAVLESTMKERS